MTRLLRLAFLALAILPALSPAQDRTPHPVLVEINRHRAASRPPLPPLADDTRLRMAAQSWATSMARTEEAGHGSGSDEAGSRIRAAYPAYRAAAEVVAEGSSTEIGVVRRWMASPPDRAALLGDYEVAGAGRATSLDGVPYWCVILAR